MALRLPSIKSVLVGRPKATEHAHHERLPKTIALAVFSSDALSSSAYATEEMLLVLAVAGTAALTWSVPLAISITVVLGIVIASYRQTVHAYPGGASAYIVASENLGKWPGLVAASALLIDYVLTVAVSIAAGVAAVVSAVPELHDQRVIIALAAIALVSMLNLRGIKESGFLFAIPTYAYIFLIGGTVVVGLVRYLVSGFDGPPTESVEATEALTILLILRAYSHGSTALTGVEAISDGVGAFREPVAKNASTTLVIMGVILAFLFIGLTVLARLYDVTGPTEDPHRTVVSLIALRVFGEGFLFYAVQIATAAILFLAANTSFADFPRLSYFLARDRYAPRQLLNRGDRLAFSNGILALGGLAAILTVIYRADVSRIINLYVVGVFTSFTLSQLGMVRHWQRSRGTTPGWRRSAGLNGLGASITFFVLCIVLATKFLAGAYIVVAAIPVLVWWLNKVRRHYDDVARALRDPARRPLPANDNHVILLVGRPSDEERRAFAYAERIRTDDFRCVHFRQADDPKGLEASWARKLGVLPTTPALQILPMQGSVTRSVREYTERLRAAVPPNDFVTVIVSERVRPTLWAALGDRDALMIKTALLFTPGAVVTDVPHVPGVPQTALDPGRPVRHVVIVLVSAVHNATMHAVEYAKTLSSDEIHAVHVVLDPDSASRHVQDWSEWAPGLGLELLDSPYRRLAEPLLDYVRPHVADDRTIATIIIPEFVVSTWWHHLLHNQNGLELKWTFLREPNVIVTSVPYRLAGATPKAERRRRSRTG